MVRQPRQEEAGGKATKLVARQVPMQAEVGGGQVARQAELGGKATGCVASKATRLVAEQVAKAGKSSQEEIGGDHQIVGQQDAANPR